MPARRILIDANLLVLFVVGQTGRQLITKHRRLREFSVDDYDRLVGMLRMVELVVTPNTLTETSNLLAQHNEPERSRFLDVLRYVIENSQEIGRLSALWGRLTASWDFQWTPAGLGRLNRSSPSCLNRPAQRTAFFHGLVGVRRTVALGAGSHRGGTSGCPRPTFVDERRERECRPTCCWVE